MNFVLHGHAVSSGITVGYAHLVATARLEVAHYEIAPDAVDDEIERFDRAMQAAQKDLEDLKSHIAADAPKEFAGPLTQPLMQPSSQPIRIRPCLSIVMS